MEEEAVEVEPRDPLGMTEALAPAGPDLPFPENEVGRAKETRTGAPGLAAVLAYPTLKRSFADSHNFPRLTLDLKVQFPAWSVANQENWHDSGHTWRTSQIHAVCFIRDKVISN